MTDASVLDFWKWFASVADRLAQPSGDQAMLGELDAHVSQFGGIVWELGPGKNGPNAFTLSPGGNRSKLTETRKIVAQAPKIVGWEFYPAKQPKQWQPVFEIQDEKGRPLRVDARLWRYASLTKKADNSTLVIVEAPNLGHLPDGYRQLAVEIAIDGMIGEQFRIEKIDELMVVDRFDPRIAARSANFTDIVSWL